MPDLKEKYEKDKDTWDECAATYEKHIVGGHPDILAFENFEEDMLDRLLHHLAKTQNRPIKLMDIGCGSGRLHLRYGAKITKLMSELQSDYQLAELKKSNQDFAYDPLLAQKLKEVWGIDFSNEMIRLAEDKLKNAGLGYQRSVRMNFEQGSAFKLKEEPDSILPVAICLVNSIGVMQGPEGAIELFKSMRRAVESAGGIAIISCYQQEYLESYGLGQYESTLDVSGQPWWMEPETYASEKYKQIAREYKLANSSNNNKLVVDVYDNQGFKIKDGHTLKRHPEKTALVLKTGQIKTFSNYESNWYSFDHLDNLTNEFWGDNSYHFKTKQLDNLRAEPAQMAVFDGGNNLFELFKNWGIC